MDNDGPIKNNRLVIGLNGIVFLLNNKTFPRTAVVFLLLLLLLLFFVNVVVVALFRIGVVVIVVIAGIKSSLMLFVCSCGGIYR